MIKKLYEEGNLLIENILIKEYNKLKLSIKELTVLLFLFNSYKEKTFSSSELAKKIGFSKNELEEILEQLIKKNFFHLFSQTKGNKIIEVFSLDKTFDKIKQLYLNEENKKIFEKQKTQLSETIEILEQFKGNCLTYYELEIIKDWYQNKKYDHYKILENIKQAKKLNRLSVNYIEKLLNQEDFLNLEQNDKADQILDKIFKKIK
ncbi:DnaD domain protein [Candidatus Phytoplasma prunorum]|uniref:DnaD domain protein n=1 Tax=Candidatus Phytoplasma prunorum TaxID=47565 RepID=UPI002FEF51EF